MSLWEKIESVRQEPEHIRRRYVALCVFVSMVFIFGIWLFSVSDGVSTASRDLPKALEGGRGIVESTPSLNDLFEQSAPLRIEGESAKGTEFFNQELNAMKNQQ